MSIDHLINDWMDETMEYLINDLRDSGHSFVTGIDDDDEAKTFALTAEACLARPAGYMRTFIEVDTQKKVRLYIGDRCQIKPIFPNGFWIAAGVSTWTSAYRYPVTFSRTGLPGVYSFRIQA